MPSFSGGKQEPEEQESSIIETACTADAVRGRQPAWHAPTCADMISQVATPPDRSDDREARASRSVPFKRQQQRESYYSFSLSLTPHSLDLSLKVESE